MKCDRCGCETSMFITSMFNTDTLCNDCKEKETKHPLYDAARRAERYEVQYGNYNFPGIGKPEDL